MLTFDWTGWSPSAMAAPCSRRSPRVRKFCVDKIDYIYYKDAKLLAGLDKEEITLWAQRLGTSGYSELKGRFEGAVNRLTGRTLG